MYNHFKRNNKLKKRRKHIDIDYLRDNSLVLFNHISGRDKLIIDYAKGSHLLEYKDSELMGTDVTNIIPVKYKSIHYHGNGDIFRNL
jgi:hypothetical protein